KKWVNQHDYNITFYPDGTCNYEGDKGIYYIEGNHVFIIYYDDDGYERIYALIYSKILNILHDMDEYYYK
ncbi:MAG: hypothetical protein K2G85_09705, partial [Muribaculaceae bacterium]|nr:hypothetical protein [Muribaculaceae bacterium]